MEGRPPCRPDSASEKGNERDSSRLSRCIGSVDWKEVAKMSPHEQMRAWVENWKRIGPELEEIKKRELRALTEKEGTGRALRVMDSRAARADPAEEPNPSSGLIEQQRLFQLMAKRSGE